MYILVFLAVTLSRSDGVDGQIVALTILSVAIHGKATSGLICRSGFFAIFSTSMLPTHVALILSGKTTVESFAGRDQTEMEASVLHREFGFLWKDHNKRKVQRRWKEEFGGVGVDDRWKVGTWKSRWTTEMGAAPLGWICESSEEVAANVISANRSSARRRSALPIQPCLWTERGVAQKGSVAVGCGIVSSSESHHDIVVNLLMYHYHY